MRRRTVDGRPARTLLIDAAADAALLVVGAERTHDLGPRTAASR
ncbi:hypothetical protein [Streptomyces koelreuteriae]